MDSPPGSARYLEHTAHIDGVLTSLQANGDLPRTQVDKLLDGHSAAELRRLVPLSYRRQVGAFFTPSNLKTKVTEALRALPAETFLDPTCGAGDLLLAATEVMPIGASLAETLAIWGTRLNGWDLHQEFTEAARRRIVLSALKRHHAVDGRVERLIDPLRHLSRIERGDAQAQIQTEVDAVVLNPPFTRVHAAKDCTWAQGKTSNAAIFFLDSLRHIKPSGHIVAILPDSLRSGTNFTKWRAVVESRTVVTQVERLGVFDDYTDIDVFLLVAQLRGGTTTVESGAAWWSRSSASETVGSLFEVRVGTVVDNRDPHDGESRPFLVARDLAGNGRMGVPERRRRFAGRLFKPPFVAIRRTSRPSEGSVNRASGVLITGNEEVAVDNHLLVAKPFKGGMKACNALIKMLDMPLTNEILDDRISCRHLTVSAIKELPWVSAGGQS
ncbi:N-6 DNA methylase [Streptomyces olivaceus]|uniref:N-6 DNA methylase n=1 Tax=Streptomyces olivaceus TaxID=47716 RepID=UPI001CCB86BB|nr:N-6 DNA methylase [Streptomyces olivaceus]MBZ6171308.1 N-6 DNA methylase [Streptomyces olivaceus]MBZ6178276.1 N-6 DNA methylase [Streptomyces olivaceus]